MSGQKEEVKCVRHVGRRYSVSGMREEVTVCQV